LKRLLTICRIIPRPDVPLMNLKETLPENSQTKKISPLNVYIIRIACGYYCSFKYRTKLLTKQGMLSTILSTA
jgi:hypothetical protein